MKQIVMLLFLICASGYAWSETIQTVGYNPARFGEYKRLKVTSGMETGGALVSPTLDGNGRSVTLSACEGQCEEAAYRVERIESVNNGTVTSTGMTATTVNGARGTVNVGNNSEIKSAVKGGEVAVKQLSASGSGLSVSEDLTLGENKIKKPGYKNCQWKWETITHEGGSAKVLALAGCEGVNVGKCEGLSDMDKNLRQNSCTYGQPVLVGQDNPTAPGIWNEATCECTCPAGTTFVNRWCSCPDGKVWDKTSKSCKVDQCSQSSYLLAHKTECCPKQPFTNASCWKKGLSWQKNETRECNRTVQPKGFSSTCGGCSYYLQELKMGIVEQCQLAPGTAYSQLWFSEMYGAACPEVGDTCSSQNSTKVCSTNSCLGDNVTLHIVQTQYICSEGYQRNGW